MPKIDFTWHFIDLHDMIHHLHDKIIIYVTKIEIQRKNDRCWHFLSMVMHNRCQPLLHLIEH